MTLIAVSEMGNTWIYDDLKLRIVPQNASTEDEVDSPIGVTHRVRSMCSNRNDVFVLFTNGIIRQYKESIDEDDKLKIETEAENDRTF